MFKLSYEQAENLARLNEGIRTAEAKGLAIKSRATTELTPALKAILAGKTYFQS
jgi:hypothetical protein